MVLNLVNVILIEEIVCYLKIFKINMLVYERSFKCVYDFCFSFMVIGGVGVVVLCLFVVLIIIVDCEGIYCNKEFLCGGIEIGDSM